MKIICTPTTTNDDDDSSGSSNNNNNHNNYNSDDDRNGHPTHGGADRDLEYLVQADPVRSQSAHTTEPDDVVYEDFDGGAIRKRKKKNSLLQHKLDLQISRTLSAMEANGVGTAFSRVAYGASKLDRMRLEAEMDVENRRIIYLVDDDETVFTATTNLHQSGMEV